MKRKRIHLMSAGAYPETTWARGLVITEEVLDALVASFEGPIPIGPAEPHTLEVDEDERDGWLLSVERRGSQLWGIVELRDCDAILAKFRHVSPVYRYQPIEPAASKLFAVSFRNDGIIGLCGMLDTAEDA